MKIYASMRGDMTSFDYYVGKDMWVRVKDDWNDRISYAKVFNIWEYGNHHKRVCDVCLIPAFYLDEYHPLSSSVESDFFIEDSYAMDYFSIISPVDVLSDSEVAEKLDCCAGRNPARELGWI